MPTARLYGFDGPNGVNQLPITDGETVFLPIFVQPDSTQEYLLGTNASISLGFKFTVGKGKSLRIDPEPDPNLSVARVSLIKATTILS